VVDLHDSGLDGLRVADAKGFEVRALKVQVEGICPECAARKKRQGASVNRTVTASR
jgi:Fe2+ or Zn2+ uptake regulation protein